MVAFPTPPSGTTLSYIMLSSGSATGSGADGPTSISYRRHIKAVQGGDGITYVAIPALDSDPRNSNSMQIRSIFLIYAKPDMNWGETRSYTRISTSQADFNNGHTLSPNSPNFVPLFLPPPWEWKKLDTISTSDASGFGTTSSMADISYWPNTFVSNASGSNINHTNPTNSEMQDKTVGTGFAEADILTTSIMSVDDNFDPATASAAYLQVRSNTTNRANWYHGRVPLIEAGLPVAYLNSIIVTMVGRCSAVNAVDTNIKSELPHLWYYTGEQGTSREPNFASASTLATWSIGGGGTPPNHSMSIFQWTIALGGSGFRAERWYFYGDDNNNTTSAPSGYMPFYITNATQSGTDASPNLHANSNSLDISFISAVMRYVPSAASGSRVAFTISGATAKSIMRGRKPVTLQLGGPNYAKTHDIKVIYPSNAEGPYGYSLSENAFYIRDIVLPHKTIHGLTYLDYSPIAGMVKKLYGFEDPNKAAEVVLSSDPNVDFSGGFATGEAEWVMSPTSETYNDAAANWNWFASEVDRATYITISGVHEYGADKYWGGILEAAGRNRQAMERMISISNPNTISNTVSCTASVVTRMTLSQNTLPPNWWGMGYGSFYRYSMSFPNIMSGSTNWGYIAAIPTDYSASGDLHGLAKTTFKNLMLGFPQLPTVLPV